MFTFKYNTIFFYLFFIPISINVSKIRFDLIHKSNGESVLKLGVWLTSKSQGFNSLSNMISNLKIIEFMINYPNISNDRLNSSLNGLLLL